MTTMHSAARRRRAVAAVGAVSAGLLALSACDAPSPVATVTVNTDTAHSEASCWNDGKVINSEELTSCLQDKDVPTLTVNPDEKVRFGVDQEIAENRWVILMNGRPLVDDSGLTYRSIPGSIFFDPQYGAQGNSTVVAIQALDAGEKTKTTGLWTFKLERGDD